jgi:hypothetical protein
MSYLLVRTAEGEGVQTFAVCRGRRAAFPGIDHALRAIGARYERIGRFALAGACILDGCSRWQWRFLSRWWR